METGVFFCGWGLGFGDVSVTVVSNCVKSELPAVLRIHSLSPAVFWFQLCFGVFFFVVFGVYCRFLLSFGCFSLSCLCFKGDGQAEQLAREQRREGVRRTWASTDFGIFLMDVSSRSSLFRSDCLVFLRIFGGIRIINWTEFGTCLYFGFADRFRQSILKGCDFE